MALINLKKWFEDRTNEVRDVFDANTAGDYQRRALAQERQGQPIIKQSYAQQQIALGNKRPMNNIGQQVFGNTARFLNTGLAAGREVYDTGRLLTADLTKNNAAWRNANQAILSRQQKQYQPNSGLLGAGTIFNTPQEFNTLGVGEITKRVGTTTLGTAGEVVPVGKGVQLANNTSRLSRPALMRLGLQGAGAAGAADIGQQYISTGKIDPKQTAVSSAIGAGLSVAPPVLKVGGQKILNTSTPVVKQTAQKAQKIVDAPTQSLIKNDPEWNYWDNQAGYSIQQASRARTAQERNQFQQAAQQMIANRNARVKELKQQGFVANPFYKDGKMRKDVTEDMIFKGVDSKPRVEFSDRGAKLAKPEAWPKGFYDFNEPPAVLSDILKHNTLYKQYPELRNLQIRLESADKLPSGLQGAFAKTKEGNPVLIVSNNLAGLGGDPQKLKSTILHEIQHAIQQKEGFARGGNDREFAIPLLKARDALNKQLADYNQKLSQAVGTPQYEKLMDKKLAIVKKIQALEGKQTGTVQEKAIEQYRNLAGEAEARTVQARLNMTPEQRAKTPFYDSLDVPKKDLIIRNGDGKAFSIEKAVDGSDVVLIEKNILDGVAPKDRVQAIRKFIQSELQTKQYPLGYGKGGNAKVTQITRNKYAQPDRDLKLRGNMAGDIPDILKASRLIKTGVPDTKGRNFSSKGFEYRTTKIQIGEKQYDVRINIGVGEKGKTFYTINGIKEAPQIQLVSRSRGGTTAYSVSENSRNVNSDQSQPPKSPPKSAPVGKKPNIAKQIEAENAYLEANAGKTLDDGMTIPKDFKAYRRTVTSNDVDIKRLKTDDRYFKQAYESVFARGYGTDEKLYKTLTKEFVPKDREASSYLADLYNKSKSTPVKPTLQDALEGRSTKVKGNTQTAVLTRPVAKIKTQLAEPPLPPAKVGVQTMSPPPPPKGTGVKMLPAGKTKETKFASKTVPESEFVSEPVKGSIKAPDYSPQTERQGYTNALGRLKQQGDEVFENSVFESLQKKPGTISRQEAIDATTAAQLLDSRGDDASIRKATDIYERLSEHYTAAGQTIQVAAILSKRTPEGMRGWATSTLKKAGVEPSTQLQAQIVTLSKEKKFTELAELVSKNIPSSTGDKIINFWRAGLLTAPTTTGGNLLGNTGEAAVRKGFVNPVATVADALMGQFTGKRTMTLAKPGELGKGAKQGVKEFGKGVDNTKYDIQRRTNYNTKALDSYVNGVYRLMGVADKPFSTAASKEALSSMAKAEAINKGLKGADKDKFIKDFIDNPPEQARIRAEQEGDYAVFKNPTTLGKAASGLKRPLGPVGDFVVPFTQVPAAIATRIVQRTPIGTAHEVMKQIKHIKSGGEFDQRAMSQAIGNGLFGPAIMGVGYALANENLLTFGYPTDKKERALWDEEGKQPYSVRVGDRWYSLNYLQPFGALLAIGGQAQEAAKRGEDITAIIGQGTSTAGQSIMNQSFLKGIGGALDAISDPERSTRKYIEQTTSSVVPNIVRSGARAGDEIQRAPEGITEGVKSGIPGLRGQTTPKYSQITGEPLPAKDNFANQYLNPLKPSKVRDSELTAELRRLQDSGEGIIPTASNKDVFGKDSGITKQQLSTLDSYVAQGISTEWNKVMADPRYKNLSDEDKKKALSDISGIVSPAIKAIYAAENGFMNDNWEPKLNAKQRAYVDSGQVDILTQAEKDAKKNTKTTKVSKSKSAKKTKVAKSRKGRATRNSLPGVKLSSAKSFTLSSATSPRSAPSFKIAVPKKRKAFRPVRIKA